MIKYLEKLRGKKVPEDIIEKAELLLSFYSDDGGNTFLSREEYVYGYSNHPRDVISSKALLRLIQVLIKLKQNNSLDVINNDFVASLEFLWSEAWYNCNINKFISYLYVLFLPQEYIKNHKFEDAVELLSLTIFEISFRRLEYSHIYQKTFPNLWKVSELYARYERDLSWELGYCVFKFFLAYYFLRKDEIIEDEIVQAGNDLLSGKTSEFATINKFHIPDYSYEERYLLAEYLYDGMDSKDYQGVI